MQTRGIMNKSAPVQRHAPVAAVGTAPCARVFASRRRHAILGRAVPPFSMRTSSLESVAWQDAHRSHGCDPRVARSATDIAAPAPHLHRTCTAALRAGVRRVGVRTGVTPATLSTADEAAPRESFGMFTKEVHAEREARESRPIALASNDGTAVAQVRAVARRGELRCPSQLISEP